MIKDDVVLGESVRIHHPDLVNLYGCTIGDNTSIGTFVEIRKTVIIGKNCKIQAFVFIPEGVTIEDEVFIGPHACFTNDKLPRATGPTGAPLTPADWEQLPTIVRRRASIGANATILCGIEIGEGAIVGAGATVTRSVDPYTLVAGNPARVIRQLSRDV